MFIFTADNGTNRSVYSSTIFRKVKGVKGETINDGNHVPLIVSWPQRNNKPGVFQGIVDFTDFLPTLAEVAGVVPSSYNADGESFLSILKRVRNRRGKDVALIHYTPRWGWPSANNQHNRWVMDGEYKLYSDGRFYHTARDPLEKEQKTILNEQEQKVKDDFEAILQEKENEFPFKWNDSEFNPMKN